MFGFNQYVLIGVGFLILTFSVYFWYAQGRIETMAKESLANQLTIENQSKSIAQLNLDIFEIKQVNTFLSNVERNSTKNAAELADKLEDMERLVKESPLVVQDMINESMAFRVRCFALATGATPTKEDELNKSCPHLLKQ